MIRGEEGLSVWLYIKNTQQEPQVKARLRGTTERCAKKGIDSTTISFLAYHDKILACTLTGECKQAQGQCFVHFCLIQVTFKRF